MGTFRRTDPHSHSMHTPAFHFEPLTHAQYAHTIVIRQQRQICFATASPNEASFGQIRPREHGGCWLGFAGGRTAVDALVDVPNPPLDRFFTQGGGSYELLVAPHCARVILHAHINLGGAALGGLSLGIALIVACVCCLRRFVGQLCSELATVSLLVFATQMVPGGSTATSMSSSSPEVEARNRGIYYAVFLSFLDIGDSVSDWITAPIVQFLGLTWDNFSSVRILLCEVFHPSTPLSTPALLSTRCIQPLRPFKEYHRLFRAVVFQLWARIELPYLWAGCPVLVPLYAGVISIL